MRKILTAVGAVLFVGALAWLYRSTDLSVFLVMAGVTTGLLIKILWLDPRRAQETPPERTRDNQDGDPPDAA